jgi:membrane-bound inhibitor of C-type lysozyme
MRFSGVIVVLALTAAGCSTTVPINTPLGGPKPKPAEPISTRVSLYACPTYGDVIIRYSFGEVALVLKDETIVLPQVEAASGSKYSDEGNLFWEKSPEAQISLHASPTETCMNEPDRAAWVDAWLRGVSFRAQGTLTNWWVEILDGDHITLGLDGGAHRVTAPAEPPSLEQGRRVYRADSDEGKLTITISPEFCTLPGEKTRYPATVSVTLHDETYTGCGRPAER